MRTQVNFLPVSVFGKNWYFDDTLNKDEVMWAQNLGHQLGSVEIFVNNLEFTKTSCKLVRMFTNRL